MPSHIVSQAQIDTICSRLDQKEDCCSDTAGIHERQSHEADIRPGERIQHREDYDGCSAAPVRRNIQTTYTITTASAAAKAHGNHPIAAVNAASSSFSGVAPVTAGTIVDRRRLTRSE